MPKRLMGQAVIAAAAGLMLVSCASEPPRQGPGSAAELVMPRVVAEPLGLLFVGLDADGDGQTARTEVEANAPQLFSRADTSGDGLIRPIEFQAFSETYLGSTDLPLRARSFDRDLDGQISEREFSAYLVFQFDKKDEDEDGILTRSDFVRTVDPTEARREIQRRRRTGPGGR